MIRKLSLSDFDSILTVINDAVQAYNGVIPKDRWKEPYMPTEELKNEIESGVVFYGWIEDDSIVGVMGIQAVKDTILIRHSYVRTRCQRQGIGGKLLKHLINLADTPVILVGTWADAIWAISFYEEHGFEFVSNTEKEKLLRKYWAIPERQIETSVVLQYNND